MSGTTYYLFTKDGQVADSIELRNSHGSAPPIWDALWQRAGHRAFSVHSAPESWWHPENHEDPRDRFLMAFTWKTPRVLAIDAIPYLAQCLQERVVPIWGREERAWHWDEVIEWVNRVQADRDDLYGLGAYWTSVDENHFYPMIGPECPTCHQEIEEERESKLVDVLNDVPLVEAPCGSSW